MNSNWKSYKLSDLTTKIGSGSTPSGGNESYKPNGISLIRSLNVYDNEFKYKGLAFIDDKQAAKLNNVILEEGDVLLNITGASVARCCVIPNDVLPARVNQHVSILRPKKEIVDSKFLSLLLNSKIYKDSLLQDGEKAGATRQALTKLQLQGFKILVPSLKEQKRIVAILDEAFAGISQAIANTEKNLANVRELFESCLNEKFQKIRDFSNNFKISKLVEEGILDKPLDGNHGEIHPKKADFVESGMPFIMASDLVNGEVDQETCNFITLSQAKSLRKGFAKDGDVLLSHKGTIGRTALLKTKHDFIILTPQVTYYRILNNKVLNNKYLYFYFQSHNFQKRIYDIAGGGSTRAYIGITRQLDLEVQYPSLSEQRRIVNELNALNPTLDNLEYTYQQKLQSLAELKQSLLQKAFSGELTANNVDKWVNP